MGSGARTACLGPGHRVAEDGWSCPRGWLRVHLVLREHWHLRENTLASRGRARTSAEVSLAAGYQVDAPFSIVKRDSEAEGEARRGG